MERQRSKKTRVRLSETRTCDVAGCGRPYYGRGLCNKHWQAARSRGLKPKTSLEAFREMQGAPADNGCRVWTGSISDNNQAKFSRDGETLAVRWGYKNLVGPLAGNEVVRHTCDNGACVNPQHWIKGTQADNVQDTVDRWRTCHGERHPRAVLNDDVVREMRTRYGSNRTLSYRQIAELYGIGEQGIRKAILGITWKHVA